jgi:anti-anti-sigma factor
MEIKHIKENSNNILYLIGKLDAFQAETLERKLNELFETGYYQFIFEMSKIDYLSSAGIRVLVKLLKKSRKLGGFIKLSALKPYPYNVLKIAGFLKVFDTYPTLSAALDSCLPQNEQQTPGREIIATDIGELSYRKTSDQPVSLVISGSNQNYLKAICTKEDIVSKPLNHFQHALGIGSLGSNIDDNFNIMGELMIINGSVIWLPTDGHNRPDFLITTGEDSQINVHTAFNLSLQGDFQAVLHYQASAEKGCQLSSLYTELFRLAEKNFPHYKGMIGTIMRADLTSVYGAGIKKAPVIDNKPANNELITHADNIKE